MKRSMIFCVTCNILSTIPVNIVVFCHTLCSEAILILKVSWELPNSSLHIILASQSISYFWLCQEIFFRVWGMAYWHGMSPNPLALLQLQLKNNSQWCPKFNNLTALTLGAWCLSADYVLKVFLQNCPNLLRLTVKPEQVHVSLHMFIHCFSKILHVQWC